MIPDFLKKIFQDQDQKELDSATEDFDALMGKVDEDNEAITRLEHHLREEWDTIHKDVNSMEKKVDEVVGQRTA